MTNEMLGEAACLMIGWNYSIKFHFRPERKNAKNLEVRFRKKLTTEIEFG